MSRSNALPSTSPKKQIRQGDLRVLALVLLLIPTPLANVADQLPPPLVTGFEWKTGASGAASEGDSKGTRITTDSSGNIYAIGYFSGRIFFGTELKSLGGHDIFLVKHDPSGALLWVRQIGGALEDEGRGIALDNTGNIYITGRIDGPREDPSLAGGKVFVRKYTTEGELLWERVLGAGVGRGIRLDQGGNLYLTGYFNESTQYGSETLISTGQDEIGVSSSLVRRFPTIFMPRSVRQKFEGA